MRSNIVISRIFSAYFLSFPLISAANAEGESAFSGGSFSQNKYFTKRRKAISRAVTAAAEVARSRPRCAAGKSLFGADGRDVRRLARKRYSHALKIRRFFLMHYVYVLRSTSDDGLYIGYSANLRKRFQQHVRGDSFATAQRGPWKLIYYEAYLEREDALGRERYLKSGSGSKFVKTQLRHYLSQEPLS